MNERDVLVRAKEALLTRGWCQGVGHDDHGSICLGIATVAPWGVMPATSAIWNAQDRLGRLAGGSGGIHIPDWNDTPGRTLEEVIALIDRALLDLEREDRQRQPVRATASRSEELVAA